MNAQFNLQHVLEQMVGLEDAIVYAHDEEVIDYEVESVCEEYDEEVIDYEVESVCEEYDL